MTAAADLILLRPELVARSLQDLGIATSAQLEQAKEEFAGTQERFSLILVRLGVLRDVEAGKRLATQLGAMPQRPPAAAGPILASAAVPPMVWRLNRLAPILESGGRLLVATDDPLAVFTLDHISRRCSSPVDAILVSEQDLAPLLAALEQQIGPAPALAQGGPGPAQTPGSSLSAPQPARPAASAPAPALERPPSGRPRNAASGRDAADRPVGPAIPTGSAAVADEPIIRLVDSMLSEAVRMRASDIHVQPSKQQLQVRYRIDGVLHGVNTPPAALHGPLVSRIKIMAGLNIAEKRLPQDGRLQLEVEGRLLDVRVSILPSLHGESIVMRLLDRSQPIRGVQEMGMPAEEQQRWDALIHRPHGLLLVTGPTGSGKTTTLYGAMSVLNAADRKLITIEDPVEYQLAGVNQVAVKSSIGLTFAAGLRSMLRQAPDVIMVGEIRDQETAQIAVQAALTGHLVLSTLHTNDAPSAVTRLIDMGIAPFLVASTLQGVLAQRLVRRLCASCRITENATEEERAVLGMPEITQVIRSTGCDRCHNSGYLGRVGLFELLALTEPLRQRVVARAPSGELRALGRQQGMRTLREDGVLKAREGLTTVSEVLRVVIAD